MRGREPSLRTRAIARAEMFEQRVNHAADAKLLRDLVAMIDRQEAALREIASYVDTPGRPVLALMAKEALNGGR